jgi:hypothetical protein
MATKAADVRTLASDHSPFLSRPEETAALLREIAET